MGADVHIVLGRINLQAIVDRREIPSSDCTAVALFGQGHFTAGDFTLMDVPKEYDLYRNYSLFSWLAGVRGNLKPIDPERVRMQLTSRFIDWLDQKWLEEEEAGTREASYPYGFYGGRDGVTDVYDAGEHSRIIHTVAYLRDFDYDQIAEERDTNHPDDRWDKPHYSRPLNGGETYREYFGPQYFKFLNYCVNERWHFVLFGFDS